MKSKFTLLAAAALLCAGAAQAQTYTFSTILYGGAESPPVTTNAGGTALVVFNTQALTVSVSEWWFDLAAPATASHIHCCTVTPQTGTASVALGFTGLTAATTGTYFNTFTLTSTAYSSLLNGTLAGKSYVNIHNATYPGGEISGFLQLQSYVAAVPEPATYALMLGGVAALGLARRRRQQG